MILNASLLFTASPRQSHKRWYETDQANWAKITKNRVNSTEISYLTRFGINKIGKYKYASIVWSVKWHRRKWTVDSGQ